MCIRDSSSNGNSIGVISNTYVTINSGSGYGETLRASSSNNVLIGTTTDNGNKFQVSGNIYHSNRRSLSLLLVRLLP